MYLWVLFLYYLKENIYIKNGLRSQNQALSSCGVGYSGGGGDKE